MDRHIYEINLPFYCLFYFVTVHIQETMESRRSNAILTPTLSPRWAHWHHCPPYPRHAPHSVTRRSAPLLLYPLAIQGMTSASERARAPSRGTQVLLSRPTLFSGSSIFPQCPVSEPNPAHPISGCLIFLCYRELSEGKTPPSQNIFLKTLFIYFQREGSGEGKGEKH